MTLVRVGVDHVGIAEAVREPDADAVIYFFHGLVQVPRFEVVALEANLLVELNLRKL